MILAHYIWLGIVLFTCSIACKKGKPTQQPPFSSSLKKTYEYHGKVVGIMDGDTFDLLLDDTTKVIRVRLWCKPDMTGIT